MAAIRQLSLQRKAILLILAASWLLGGFAQLDFMIGTDQSGFSLIVGSDGLQLGVGPGYFVQEGFHVHHDHHPIFPPLRQNTFHFWIGPNPVTPASFLAQFPIWLFLAMYLSWIGIREFWIRRGRGNELETIQP